MSETLTEVEAAILKSAPFQGPEIGSNFWPMLCIEKEDGGELDGEVIDSLARRGLLSVEPASKIRAIPADAVWETPDVDCRYRYRLSEAGTALLRSLQSEEPSNG